jgi:hypothetical protein
MIDRHDRLWIIIMRGPAGLPYKGTGLSAVTPAPTHWGQVGNALHRAVTGATKPVAVVEL